ncbi:hypothetical protein [Deinococcus peraridilitoris]|uniref:Ig-like domain-containing protein n=1 Tax=Deinococcus peraridilitoris (strain DSM 19664 / LMG 22246 / CIP 109416 / KR-200) TaxID=937777 RepID=L0A4U6_DEIPD|nr:hypothetical protein [Deinococcus peraridilitoris]AFZ68881.1 hypothetical protein Deipe_3448 [Deinococcus peraridilitoris DSM 19664]
MNTESSSLFRRTVFLMAAFLSLGLSACRYTTFPLAPPTLQGEFPARLSEGLLARDGGDLTLTVRLDARSKSGFLTVAWFRDDTELGRDRVYLDIREPTAQFRLGAPEPGFYRAVVLFEGAILRQFELEEVPVAPSSAPAPPAPGGAP